jgi:hypothetical protein
MSDQIAIFQEKSIRKRLRQEDRKLSTNWGTICPPLDFIAADEKNQKINCDNAEGIDVQKNLTQECDKRSGRLVVSKSNYKEIPEKEQRERLEE